MNTRTRGTIILAAALLIGGLAWVQAEEGRGDEKRWEGIKQRIEGAVKRGDITREEADAKYREIKEDFALAENKGRQAKDPRKEKFHAAEEKIIAAVKAGKLSREDAGKKLHALKKQIWADKDGEQNQGKEEWL
ncbi:MAG: hypothetical protein VCG02_02290, partial [Verrucomicrobiota bacterium]